ncbi:PrgI family protein [Patescibacteria group bacterium]|nr:PrgI family protein [Patescibacteria group bacterium]
MRFEVPQFIEIEDRIIGPFSWRQFLYLGGGLGMGVVLFLTTPFIVFLLIGLPLAVLALALAFYPINNRPFSFFLEAMFNYFYNHRLYLWRRKEQVIYKKEPAPSTVVDDLTTTSTQKPRHQSISSLSRQLELQALQKKDL